MLSTRHGRLLAALAVGAAIGAAVRHPAAQPAPVQDPRALFAAAMAAYPAKDYATYQSNLEGAALQRLARLTIYRDITQDGDFASVRRTPPSWTRCGH